MTIIDDVLDAHGRLHARIMFFKQKWKRRVRLAASQGRLELDRAYSRVNQTERVLKTQSDQMAGRVNQRLDRAAKTARGVRRTVRHPLR